jgi:hypothetical protein
MTLESEIKSGALRIATDSYDMSVGELMNLYRDDELVVNPEFQRLFRWDDYQKSHLIESLLIGVPIPSIFVFELEDGKWELIDGLQRVSTMFEFAGILKDENGNPRRPSVLEGTGYLPSLKRASWDGSPQGSKAIGVPQQISIKRARLTLQILRKSSDEQAKYDLFQRLNSHESQATPQELRNCILYMYNKAFFSKAKNLAQSDGFKALIQPSDRSSQNQALMDFFTRFLVFNYIDYDKTWDIEEYLNNGIIELSRLNEDELDAMIDDFEQTISLLTETGELDILRRYRNNRFQGRVGQAAYETIFLGVSQNIKHIRKKRDPEKFIITRTKELWDRKDVISFTRAGQR